MAEKADYCPLLVLPLEIRTVIYHFIWDDDKDVGSVENHCIPALAAAYPVIQHECCDVFLRPCYIRKYMVIQELPEAGHKLEAANHGVSLRRYRKFLTMLDRDKQIIFRDSLAHVNLIEFTISCHDYVHAPGVAEGKRKVPYHVFRRVCSIKMELLEPKELGRCAITLEKHNSESYPIEYTRGPWTEKDPEYAFGMLAARKLQTLFLKVERPLRYSQALLQGIITVLDVSMQSIPGLEGCTVV